MARAPKRSTPDAAAARPASPQPTASDVLALYRGRLTEGDEARLRRIATTMRQLVRMEHKVVIPRQYRAITKQMKTPYVRDAWHRIVAALTHERPVAHIEPLSASETDRRAANIGERWTMAVLEQVTRELQEDIVYEAPRALTRDGESVIKVVHKPDAWANFPARIADATTGKVTEAAADYEARVDTYKRRANTPLPLAMRVVDRLQMLFGDGEYGDEWALEYGEYPRPYLASRYGMRPDARDDRLVRPEFVLGGAPWPEGYAQASHGQSQKLEFWSEDWWHVVVDGQDAPGFPKPNPFAPRLPYFRAKADSDSESPLYSLCFLVPGLDQALTMKMNWAYLGAYPNPVTETVPTASAGGIPDPLGEGDENTTLQWRPGKAIDLPAGKKMSFLVPPPVGQDLNELITIYRSLIDVAGIPSIMRSVGGESGYDTNQKYSAALALYRRLAVASARQLECACEFLWWVVEHRVRQSVFVLAEGDERGSGKKWLGLGTDVQTSQTVTDVAKLGPLTWSFRPQLPTDEQARTMIAIQGTNAANQLFSRRWALEELLHVEDPEAMADEIAVEKALDEEPLKSLWRDRALKDAGLLPQPPPPTGLVGPDGQPIQSGPPPGPPMLPPGPGQLTPNPVGNGQGVPGMPAVPGITMPLGPPTPPPGGGFSPAVSVPGGYPGMPPGQGPPLPAQA